MATRGRPPFKPTAAQRQKVEQLISCSMSQQAIAHVLGIDDDTLRKHFADELSNGTARKRAEVVGMLYRSAKGGNVSEGAHSFYVGGSVSSGNGQWNVAAVGEVRC